MLIFQRSHALKGLPLLVIIFTNDNILVKKWNFWFSKRLISSNEITVIKNIYNKYYHKTQFTVEE